MRVFPVRLDQPGRPQHGAHDFGHQLGLLGEHGRGRRKTALNGLIIRRRPPAYESLRPGP